MVLRAPMVVLYGKPGCHLCEEALVLLRQTGQSLGFDLTVEEVDITSDPTIEEKYWDVIPVVVLGDGTVLTAPIEPGTLRAALQAAVR